MRDTLTIEFSWPRTVAEVAVALRNFHADFINEDLSREARRQRRRWDYLMDIRPIKSEADYDAALAEVEALWGAEPDTAEGDRLRNCLEK